MRGRKNKEGAKKIGPSFSQKLIQKYKTICYRVLGSLFKNEQKNQNLTHQLKMANMRYTAEIFLSTIIITGTIITIVSLFIYLFLFNILISSESWLLYVLALTAINSSLGFSMFYIIMKMRISNRKMQIDQEIPFILSELSVLASTGLTPIKIVRHIAKRKEVNPQITAEFKKIVHKIDIEGKDIVTALSETAQETPSDKFRETLWDLSNMIHQGGDLDEYLRQKADQTMQLRRDIQKSFTEKLAGYLEIYVSLVLMSVLFLGIAAFMMNVLATSMGPFDADTLLLMLAYALIPLAAIVVNIIISTAYSRGG